MPLAPLTFPAARRAVPSRRHPLWLVLLLLGLLGAGFAIWKLSDFPSARSQSEATAYDTVAEATGDKALAERTRQKAADTPEPLSIELLTPEPVQATPVPTTAVPTTPIPTTSAPTTPVPATPVPSTVVPPIPAATQPPAQQPRRVVTAIVVVFPGDVVGLEANDRLKRLTTIRDTWAARAEAWPAVADRKPAPSSFATLPNGEGVDLRFKVVYVPAAFAPARDEGLAGVAGFQFWQRPLSPGGNSSAPFANRLALQRAVFADFLSAPRYANAEFIVSLHDHSFLIIDNLACFLGSLLRRHGLGAIGYHGSVLAMDAGNRLKDFISDATGSVLTRAAAAHVEAEWSAGRCGPAEAWMAEMACHVVAMCLHSTGHPLQSALGPPVDPASGGAPADEKPRPAELFNVYTVVRTAKRMLDKWFIGYKGGADRIPHCCARMPVAFHYTEYPEQKFLFDALMKAEPPTAAWLAANWPKNIGGYSSRPVDVDDVSLRFFRTFSAFLGQCAA